MLGDFIGVIAGWLGSLIGRRLGVPRPVSHPDGSVTVPGLVYGFDAPSYASHHGWIGGYVTVAADTVTHSIDREGKISRRAIPRQDAFIVIRAANAEEAASVLNRTVVCITVPGGRRFMIAIDPSYRHVLSLLDESAVPDPQTPSGTT